MTLRADPVVRVGAYRIVALCHVECCVRHLPAARGIVARAGKRPEAIVIAGPDGVVAYTPDGAPRDPAHWLATLPGLATALGLATEDCGTGPT